MRSSANITTSGTSSSRSACRKLIYGRGRCSNTRDAIEAHLTVVFTALAVARYLQAETGISIGRIVKTLRPLQEIRLTIAGQPHTAADPLTADAARILTALDIPHS